MYAKTNSSCIFSDFLWPMNGMGSDYLTNFPNIIMRDVDFFFSMNNKLKLAEIAFNTDLVLFSNSSNNDFVQSKIKWFYYYDNKTVFYFEIFMWNHVNFWWIHSFHLFTNNTCRNTGMWGSFAIVVFLHFIPPYINPNNVNTKILSWFGTRHQIANFSFDRFFLFWLYWGDRRQSKDIQVTPQ